MMSFLTYIKGFFMNFELLPILTDYEIKKKSSRFGHLKKFLFLVMAAILDTGRH
jgi:hypothetical protein